MDRSREQHLLAEYEEYVTRSYREQFGVLDSDRAAGVAQGWFGIDGRHEDHFAELRQRAPHARRVLDLASGMGTATLYGLASGLDGYGIEPDPEKLSLMRRRMTVGDQPPEVQGAAPRFARAVGERLPYREGTFDAVLSYQTLEHVQNIDAVIAEMLRVVKPGGALHLRCPDYRSTYEAHYHVAWLPLMPRMLARAYLRLRGRPVAGLAGIVYTTRPRLLRALESTAARAGLSLVITDLEHERVRARLREKGLPAGRLMVRAAQAAQYVRSVFRRETQVNLWITT